MKKRTAVILCLALLIAMLSPAFFAIQTGINRSSTIEFCSNVAQLNRDYKSLDEAQCFDEYGNRLNYLYENRLIVKGSSPTQTNATVTVNGPRYSVLQYNTKEELNKDYDLLKNQGLWVEKDYILFASTAESTNPSGTSSYSGSYYYCGMDYAKGVINSSGIVYDDITVGVVDSGVWYNHEVYEGRYIKTGVNFSASGQANDEIDDNGHGTATSSIILMSTPNNVKVKGYKVIDSNGSATTSALIATLEYIIAERDKPQVLNLSIGGYEFNNNAMELFDDAFKRLGDAGVSICVAAGNEYVLAEYNSIGGCDSVITVASCDNNGNFSSFSDYGRAIDITAPGEEVYCAVSGSQSNYTSTNMTGTSVASPYVAAACTYLLMQNPNYTPQEIKSIIKDNAIKVSPEDEYYYGSGILNCINLVDKGEQDNEIVPSVVGGEYEGSSLSLALSSNTPDGQIYYTKYPGMPYLEYDGSNIEIDQNMTISYALKKDGKFISNISSQSYTFNYTAQSSDFKITLGKISEVYIPDKKINVIIPGKLGLKTPTSIGASAFANKNYNKVILPDSVTSLGAGAFNNAKIRELVGNGVTKFGGKEVFASCSRLQSVTLPKLSAVTESAFENCSSLNYIDFGANIKKLQTKAFASTAIVNADFPNAEYPSGSCTDVFYNARIFTCNLPLIDTLNESLFNGCAFLHKLTTKPIKTIFPNALRNTSIFDMDLSQLTTLYKGALSGVRIENFYAPGVTKIADTSTATTNTLGAKFTQCTTINLPNLTGELTDSSLYYSTVKNLILPKITAITSQKTFYNMPLLEFVYLPMATIYNSPTRSVGSTDELFGYLPYCNYSKPRLVFIPNATEIGQLTFKDFGAIYATSAQGIDITVSQGSYQGSIILSDTVKDNSITVSCAEGGIAPNIIVSGNTTQSENVVIVSPKKCSYTGCEGNLLSYKCNEGEFSIPLEYVKDYFGTDMLNSDMNKTHAFLFDFHDDDIINAKDYAIFRQILIEQ